MYISKMPLEILDILVMSKNRNFYCRYMSSMPNKEIDIFRAKIAIVAIHFTILIYRKMKHANFPL